MGRWTSTSLHAEKSSLWRDTRKWTHFKKLVNRLGISRSGFSFQLHPWFVMQVWTIYLTSLITSVTWIRPVNAQNYARHYMLCWIGSIVSMWNIPPRIKQRLFTSILPWLISCGVASIACQPSKPSGRSDLFIHTSFHTWKFLGAFRLQSQKNTYLLPVMYHASSTCRTSNVEWKVWPPLDRKIQGHFWALTLMLFFAAEFSFEESKKLLFKWQGTINTELKRVNICGTVSSFCHPGPDYNTLHTLKVWYTLISSTTDTS